MNLSDIWGAFTRNIPDIVKQPLLRIPLAKWAKSVSAPPSVCDLVEEYFDCRLMHMVSDGVRLPVSQEKSRLRVKWIPLKYVSSTRSEALSLPFLANPMMDARTGDDYVAVLPIGYRALTEGNAFNVQSLMASVHAAGPQRRGVLEFEYADKLGAYTEECFKLVDLYPYNVTRRACQVALWKKLKTKSGEIRIVGGHPELALADFALMQTAPRAALLHTRRTPLESMLPGVCFARALEVMSKILSGSSRRKFEIVELLDLISQELGLVAYSSLPSVLLAKWRREAERVASHPVKSVALADRIIPRVLAWYVQILEQRVRSPRLFIDPRLYIDSIGQLPTPPLTYWLPRSRSNAPKGTVSADSREWLDWLFCLRSLSALLGTKGGGCVEGDQRLRGLGSGMFRCDHALSSGLCPPASLSARYGQLCPIGALLATQGFRNTQFESID